MATLNISDRRATKEKSLNKRSKLTGIQLSAESLDSLKKKVNELMEYSEEESSKVILMHQGQLLFEERCQSKSLESLGLQDGACIHILNRAPKKEKTPLVPREMDEIEVSIIVCALSSTIKSPAFKKVVKDPAVIDSLMTTCKNLPGDRIAQAFLAKPEMLLHLLDNDTLIKVGKNHPGLIEAIERLSVLVQEEVKKPSSSPPGSSNGQSGELNPFSLLLDNLSDEDEEMEDGSRSGAGSQQPTGAGVITPEILSAALRNAQAPLAQQQQTPPPPPPPQRQQNPSPLPSGSSSGNIITADNFQRALALVTRAASYSRPDYSNQIAIMREMGIDEEDLAQSALEIMSGDLQAAVDLMLSGWLG